MRDIKTYLACLSHHPGVYQMMDVNGVVLYVGKAKDLKKRVTSYFRSSNQDRKTLSLVKQIHSINTIITNTENEAVLLECNLIKQHRPRYNVLLRDDKSYPYIVITQQHEYPRIDVYRGQRLKNAAYFGPYPSAFAVREAISLLQKLFKIRTCRDTYFSSRVRPCLLYQIERCTAPCVNLISAENYQKNINLAVLFLEGKSDEVIKALQVKMQKAANDLDFEEAREFRDQINRLRQIQHKQYAEVGFGDADVLGFAEEAGVACIQLLTIRAGKISGSRSFFPRIPLHSSEEEIISAFIAQYYLKPFITKDHIPKTIIIESRFSEKNWLEKVLSQHAAHKVKLLNPVRLEKKKWLMMAITSAKQSLSMHLTSKASLEKRMQALQVALNLSKKPNRMECFDISHTMGEAVVASCVVFDENGPQKSAYRRFNIKNITPGDDIKAMKQVLDRRFKRLQKENTVLPDIIFIDGGKAQVNAAISVLEAQNIHEVVIVGISKGPDRKEGFETLHIGKQPSFRLPADSQALHFIQQIRNEAHRFAITSHRQKRDKIRRTSTLESIEGIGAKRRRELLRYFGGIQGVAHASLDELMKVPGISRSLAERIFAILHETI